MVGFYFEKRRAFATGVAVCGSGIGAFVFAPMCEKLLTIYNWKGATWIVAGIVLNGVVMGALFRPLETERLQRCQDTQTIPSNQEEKEVLKTGSDDPDMDTDAPTQKSISPVNPADPTALIHAKMKEKLNKELANDSNLNNSACIKSCHDLSHPNTTLSLIACNQSMSLDDLRIKQQSNKQMEKKVKDMERPMYRKDIFYSGSVQNLPEYKSNQDMQAYVKSVTSIPCDIPPEKDGLLWSCLRFFKSMTDTLREMMDFSLLKNPVFCLYGLACFLCMTGRWKQCNFLIIYYVIRIGVTEGQE